MIIVPLEMWVITLWWMIYSYLEMTNVITVPAIPPTKKSTIFWPYPLIYIHTPPLYFPHKYTVTNEVTRIISWNLKDLNSFSCLFFSFSNVPTQKKGAAMHMLMAALELYTRLMPWIVGFHRSIMIPRAGSTKKTNDHKQASASEKIMNDLQDN